ncbi:DUF2846 domain-containing protein [Achromobacter xylosoxidans]|uniref:DUF2846 domain-containing protein n=1 Tax=Alcaligenes xylosoxydans xylosoxydans TaxID=85698 RepID=UPI001788CDA4|nr:DUF2846 domain-containing protein [Achromobacter xylosoxidans]
MNRRTALSAAVAVMAVALAGCAGTRYETAAAQIPPIPQGQGRIYFYQLHPNLVTTRQQKLRVNGVVVGRNKQGGFFFVDRPAGSYVVTSLYWTDSGVSFMLDAGQTRYVRVDVASNDGKTATGKAGLTLVDPPETAEFEMRRLRYWGAASSEQVPGL